MTRATIRGRLDRAMLALFALLVTSCGLLGDAGDGSLARPGEVLFVRAERRAELAALPPSLRAAWCGSPSLAALAAAAASPVAELDDGEDRPDPSAQPFARAIMAASAASFGLSDPVARGVLADLLERWASATALDVGGSRPTANRRYALARTLLPTIVAFWLIRDPLQPRPAEERVAAWLDALVREDARRQETAGERSARNNHFYLHASVQMAWGALTGDAKRFALGSLAYRQALRDMRADGSLPLETRRGARALWYQRHAIASLVLIAEMAAVQGHDLYGLEIDGRSIHRAIGFLLDAIADPRRVERYAAANEKPGPEPDWRRQDLGFLKRRGHGRHYMAWAEIYAARFPDRPEARRLVTLLRETDPNFRPMVDDYGGGNTTCFFAKLGRTVQTSDPSRQIFRHVT